MVWFKGFFKKYATVGNPKDPVRTNGNSVPPSGTLPEPQYVGEPCVKLSWSRDPWEAARPIPLGLEKERSGVELHFRFVLT